MAQTDSTTIVPRRAGAFPALLCLLLVSACVSPGVRLSDADRASLSNQPAIQVVHYETPLPAIKADGKNPPPAATKVRKHAAADPAALIAQSFSRLLGKKDKLKNLRVESRPLPPPVTKDMGRYREKYKHGLVLELWVDEWKFNPLPADTKIYQMTLSVRSRLMRVEDGRVLWSTGRCSLGNGSTSANNRDLRLASTDLTAGTKLRKTLALARDECARKLMRDFDVRGMGRK
jgi:hypothetical protein